ncbi:MAG: hypothetical protein ACE5NP_06125 [Anaerolineae bacterium]
MNDDNQLRLEQILSLEFQYAQETATQAQEDRARVVGFYLTLVGILSTIILALLQRSSGSDLLLSLSGVSLPEGVPSWAFSVIFWLMGIVGLFTLTMLVRLRQAWHDSVRTMNAIKDYYDERFSDIEFQTFMRWRTDTIPAPGRLWSITFNLALLVTLLDSVAMGVGFAFLNLAPGGRTWADEVAVGLLIFVWQWWWYFYQLGFGRESISSD